MDEKDKQKQRDRHGRYLKKHVDRDEQQRREASSRLRRAEQRPLGPRRNEWTEDEDVTFEKIAKGSDRGGHPNPRREVNPDLPRATVLAVHHGRVELDTGEQARIAPHLALDPTLRLAVGDHVAFSSPGGQARVEAILERRTCLGRPDPGNPNRDLILAANIDVAVIVVAAADPPLRPGLIDRILLGLSRGNVDPAICVNKIDLLSDREREDLQTTLAPYRELSIPVVMSSATARSGLAGLRRHLMGKTCVFVGHSGVGKSSILNALDPYGVRSTGDLRADGKGRHTTTSSSLRDLGDGTRVIDTPGIRAFGLGRMDPAEVKDGFQDFSPFAGGCRYGDCTHVQEPECGVRSAADRGDLPRARYESYLRILASLESP